MPDTPADGRYVGSELKTEIENAAVPTGEETERPLWRIGDLAYFAFFIAFFVGAIFVLALGIGSFLAHVSPHLHQSFHVRGDTPTGQIARIYKRMADASHVVPSGPTFWVDLVFSVFNLALAVFLLWLRPRDRTARLLAVAMVGTAGVFNLTSQATLEILPLTQFESVAQAIAHISAGITYAFALILFPDGRPIPRWRGPALIGLYLPFTVAAVFLAQRVQGTARMAALLLFFGIVVPVAGVAAQAYRFRVSNDPAEHQQARLLFWALLPAIGIGIWFVVTQGFASIDVGLPGRHISNQPPVVIFRVFQPVFLLVPLALFFGLLRYRLWDIDRVINRTLVYGIATAIPFAFYLGIVVLLQRLLRPITAQKDIPIAISTLLAAAVFFPVRRRVQDFVDRRFYRHRYDAQKTIEAFSYRLRNEVDLEALAFELRGVVARTMQPSHLSLLVKGDEGRMQWQWTYRGRPRD